MRTKAFIGLVCLLSLALTLAACSPRVTDPAPQTAISFPYKLGEIAPLQFELTEQQQEVAFEVSCKGDGLWQSLQVNANTSQSRLSPSLAMPEAAACESSQNPIFAGSLFRLDELVPGERIEISLVVTHAREQAETLTRTLVVGDDGTLYPVD